MIGTLRLGLLELKRFRTPLQIAGLIFLLCVPLLYGAIYLWSNWNPYGRINQVPVAVVDNDQGVTVGGQRVDGGAQVAAQLRTQPPLGWRFVSGSEAARGLTAGRYYAVITIPAGFSANLASAASGPPQRASMSVELDDANNYLVGVMAETVQSELQRQVAAAAVATYFKVAFARLGELQDGLNSAADGAGQLHDGLKGASKGSTALVSGLSRLSAGASALAPGAAAVASGVDQVTAVAAPLAEQLASGLPALAADAASASGAATTLTGAVAAVTSVGADLADRVVAWLQSLPHAVRGIKRDPVYQAVTGQVAAFAAQARLAAGGQAAVPSSAALSDGLARLIADRPAVAKVAGYQSAQVAAHLADGQSSWLLSQVAARSPALAAAPVYDLLLKLATLQDERARAVDQLALHVYSYMSAVNEQVQALQAQVPGAQSRLRDLAGQLRQLDSGAAQVAAGASALTTGAGSALGGARKLSSGTGQLLTGAGQLAGGLTSAAGQVPAFQPDDAEVLASPVNVTVGNLHPARVYGRGLAPFFFPIALWVFGIVAFLLLRPVSGRLLASQAGSVKVAFAAWLPVLFVGAGAALLLYTVVDLCLGLKPVNAPGTIGLMLLGVAAFSAIVHVLRLAFGAVGDALALVLLILQLVSCGGLYPVQTLPEPFRVINRVIPMTYLVRALRVTISGGNSVLLWNSVLILSGFLLCALVLLCLVVARQRTWTMFRLKPELQL